MRTVSWIAAAALVALGLAGASACDSDFEPGSRITKLRLLALQADQPFARPGERVQLRLLAADPEARPLQWAWASCSQTQGSTVDSCLDALDQPLQGFDPDANELSVEIPEDALSRLPAGGRPSALLGVVVVACPGEIEAGKTAGIPVLCRDPDGDALPITEFEVGMKRIFVRADDRNQNPRFTRVTWEGKDWPEGEEKSTEPCTVDTDDLEDCPKKLRHRIGFETAAAESGVDENGTRFHEQLIVQAYATHGVFESEVRIAEDAQNIWAAQPVKGEDLATLWFVVRDDRGGMDWVSRQVRVRR